MTGILLVDDALMLRMLASNTLSGSDGWSVCEAANASEALDALERERFSIMLTDFHMPGMDGVQLAMAVRSMPEHATMPIIMLTSDDDPFIQREARAAGVDDFIMKPFKPEDLHEAVRRLIESTIGSEGASHASSAQFGPQALIDTFPFSATVLDREHRVIMGNEPFFTSCGVGISDEEIRCCEIVHGECGAPRECPLAVAVATGRPCERRVSDPRAGSMHVTVYPMDPRSAGGRELFLHLARPED